MYTIRQILGATLGLNVSGVKMIQSAPTTAPTAEPAVLDPLNQAKELLKKIREASVFKSTELNQLTELLKKAGSVNDDKNKALKTELTSELQKPTRTQAEWNARDYRNPTEGDKKDIQALLDAWNKDFKDAVNTKEVATTAVTEKTKKVFDTAKVEMPPENIKLGDLVRENNGNLTVDTMKLVLADLDGSSEIESTNRGWFKRTFVGGGEQHFPIGELQVFNELKDHIKDKATMDALAVRLGVSLPWDTKLDAVSIHRDDKIQAFRKALVQEVSDVASISALILGNEKSRTGLTSVITGKTNELQNALRTNTNALKNIQAFVEKNPNMAEQILGILTKIGIMLPLAVLSSGKLAGFVESTELSRKDGETGSLTAKKEIGKSGSIAASIDAMGVRLEANANDQGVRIISRTKVFLDAVKPKNDKIVPKKADIMNAVEGAIKLTGEDIKDDKKKGELTKLSETYKKSQEKIMTAFESNIPTTSDVPALLDQLTQNTFTYYARVEELQGFQFKGLWAGLMAQGIGLGLSGAMTSVSYSDNGTRLNAAVGEATVNSRVLTQPEKVKLLNGEKYSYTIDDSGIETIKIKGYNKNEALSPDLQKLQNSGHLTIVGDTLVIKTKNATENLFVSPKIINRVDGGKTTIFDFSINEGKKEVKFEEKDGIITITGYKKGEGMSELEKLGNRVTQAENGVITVKPENSNETLKLNGKTITVELNKGIDAVKNTELYSQDATDILAQYPQASEWRRKYPKAFGTMQAYIMSGKMTEAWTALSNIKDKDIQKLIKAGKDKSDEVKEDILSSLVNETVGIKDFRNYGKVGNKDKRTFGQVHALTHPKSVLAQYDLNDAKAFGFKDLKTAMIDSDFKTYVTAKNTTRTELHKTLANSTEKIKPVEKLTDNNGFFTLVNFAQSNGGLNGLKSQHVDEIVKGSQSEISNLSNQQKARLLAAVFADPRYQGRVDALKSSAKSGMTGTEALNNKDLADIIILGSTIRGVKLESPIKFYRAEYSKCANEMIMISKPKFVSENKDTTVATVTTPPTQTEDFVGQGSTVAGDRVSVMSAGLGVMSKWKSEAPEEPKPPTTEPGNTPGTPAPTPGTPPVRPPVAPPGTPPPTPNVPNPTPAPNNIITQPGVTQTPNPTITTPPSVVGPGSGIDISLPTPIATPTPSPGVLPGTTPPAPVSGGR